MCTKVSLTLGRLKYAKKQLPQETVSDIYRGIIEPYFRCCRSVWGAMGNHTSYTAESLEKLLNLKFKKQPLYLYLNSDFDIFLFLCYFSTILILYLGYILLLYIFILHLKF